MSGKLKELLGNGKPPENQTGGGTPAAPDDECIAVGTMNAATLPRPANKPLPRLHIVKNDGSIHTMMYYQLDSHAIYKGGEFKLLFVGAKHWEVTAMGSGPRFWEIYDYLTLARWPFLVEATHSFRGGDGDTVFDSIEIKDVTPKER